MVCAVLLMDVKNAKVDLWAWMMEKAVVLVFQGKNNYD